MNSATRRRPYAPQLSRVRPGLWGQVSPCQVCGVRSRLASLWGQVPPCNCFSHDLPFTHMARPLRIEFPGALYHVTSRGNRQETIFEDDEDREVFLGCWPRSSRVSTGCAAYCLMGNHYHLVIETPDGKLSRACDSSTVCSPGLQPSPPPRRASLPGTLQGHPGG